MSFADHLLRRYIVAVWGNAARAKAGWNQKLTYPSLMLWRIGVPICIYFWLSLQFSLLFKAFQIPTEASYGRGKVQTPSQIQMLIDRIGGFMVLWMLNWATLCAVGLVLESMVALLTPTFAPCTRLLRPTAMTD